MRSAPIVERRVTVGSNVGRKEVEHMMRPKQEKVKIKAAAKAKPTKEKVKVKTRVAGT